jgi:hypothetical protein
VLVGAPTVLPDQLAPIVPGGGNPLGEYRAEGFSRVFYAAAASFAVALVALMLLEEKPLQTTHD